jgi:hypothetical protein
VPGELRVCLQDAVCGGVVAGCVHGIRAGLVEGGGKSHIACVPTGDCYFCHGVWSVVLVAGEICLLTATGMLSIDKGKEDRDQGENGKRVRRE